MNTSANSLETWQPFLTKEGVTAHARNVYERYEKTTFYINPTMDDKWLAPFGKLPMQAPAHIPDGICAWTSGMALLAGRLKKNKNLDQLMVAHTIESFITSLREKCDQEAPLRFAWVICPAQSWCPLPRNFPIHKICVGIETAGKGDKKIIKVALLDGLPIGRQGYITPNRFAGPLPQDIWEGYGIEDKFNAPELVCRAFFKAINGLNATSEIYHCPIIRQKEDGCEIFALKDAQFFLKNVNFFTQIKTQEAAPFPIKNATLHKITHLPAEHMKGTQSLDVLEKYNEDLLSMLSMNEISLTSEEIHQKIYRSKKYLITDLAGENKNAFTLVKALKYSSWAIEMMEKKPEEARALIGSTLLL